MRTVTPQHKKKLAPEQEKKLAAHKKHHTKKHVAEMKDAMRKGKSFEEAHVQAQKNVGK